MFIIYRSANYFSRNFSEPKLTFNIVCFMFPAAQNPKIFNLLSYVTLKHKILTFEKVKPAEVWSFSLNNNLNNELIIKIDWSINQSVNRFSSSCIYNTL